jgi:hypothetical protein
MGSLSLPTLANKDEGGRMKDEQSKEYSGIHPSSFCLHPSEVLLVASFGDAVAADYAAYACRLGEGKVTVVADTRVLRRVEAPARPYPLEDLTQAAPPSVAGRGRFTALILFLNSRLSERDRRALDNLLAGAGEWGTEFIGVVSTFRAHLGDPGAAEAEAHVLARAQALRARTVVFRPGHVLSRNSRAGALLRRWGFSYPLVPRRLRGCCLDGDELFAAIEAERRGAAGGPRPTRPRLYALLGPNRPWRDLLAEHRSSGPWRACLTAACALLALLLVGQLAALALAFLARRRPSLRRWDVGTLRPHSLGELLALYNKYNYRHVKVVGYNNGVVHFGQSYPGKTVVSTVHCNRVAHAEADVLKADCGVTVRQALDFLAGGGQELPVVPNYSYVCLGTAFFIPIHGSASDFSTVADTITRVVLYDPVHDRMIAATRDEPAFREYVYNLRADVLLLRLYLRVKPRSRYYVHRQTLKDPGSGEILSALRDVRATNVEIRKSRASSDTVTVSRYYRDPGHTASGVLELPRDALGRLWDRLEENPVTSFAMHAATRYFAYHLELFFTAEEFAVFWETHRALPLRKLQLRYLRRDGLPHSAFREHDCVSVDLFMFRRHRRRFNAYLQRTFAVVRTNPGKQSR